MHGRVGIQSAMAIKRQRRLREQAKKRALERERRLSSSTNSVESLEFHPIRRPLEMAPEHSLASSIGMLHLGVCFLVLGIFFLGSGLLPDSLVTWRGEGWFNELVITGIFVIILGVFLVVLNRVMNNKEENDLEQYVQRQLTRSRSGHRLERDHETGGLTTKHNRRMKEKKNEDNNDNVTIDIPPIHSPNVSTNEEFVYQNGEIALERIDEEDTSERDRLEMERRGEMGYFVKETMSTTTTATLSPGSPCETRELITYGRSYSTKI